MSKALEALFLLPVQHQGALDFGGPDLPAAQHGPLRKADIAQLFQPFQGGQGGPRVVADVLYCSAAQGAQQLQGASLQGGGFGPGGGEGHGLFRRGSQGHHLFGFVVDPAPELLLRGDPFFPEEIGNRLLKNRTGSHGCFQRVFLRRTAQLFQPPQNRGGPFLADGGRLPAALIGEGESRLGVEPRPRREHGPNGVKKGAEIPLPQKGRQAELVGGEQGFVVQHPLDRLQPRFLPRLYGKDDPFRSLVGPPEGNLDPVAGPQLHPLRDAVGIGLVNGKNSRGNSDFPDHKPSGFSALVLFLHIAGQLPRGNLTDGHGDGLVGQVLLESLGLRSNLACPVGHQVHQQITALHIFQQISNRGIKHFYSLQRNKVCTAQGAMEWVIIFQ